MRYMIISLVLLASIFVAAPAVAQEDKPVILPGTVLCGRVEVTPCPDGPDMDQKEKDACAKAQEAELRAETKTCQVDELQDRLHRLERLIPKLKELSDRNASYEVKIAELKAMILTDEDVRKVVDELLAVSRENFEQLLEMKTGALFRLYEGNSKDLVELKAELEALKAKNVEQDARLDDLDQREIQAGFGGALMVAYEGTIGGVAGTVYLPLGDGVWSLNLGGFIGAAAVNGNEGLGYGASASVTYGWEAGDWVVDLGPAVVAGFDAGTGASGFESVTMGAGLEARASYADWVVVSITPFLGAGGVKTEAGGSEYSLTGGALVTVGVTPF